MIDWPDGEARAPSNETMRQIPQPYGTWVTQTWISRTGTVWKRYYNFQLGRWHWDDGPAELVLEDATGRVGIRLSWFLGIELAIALAWLPRCPGSTVGMEQREDSSLHARHLRWADGGEAAYDEPVQLQGERWRPLRWSVGPVVCDDRYEISSKGRLRSPHTGRVTRGVCFGDTRVAAVRGAGIVDLHAAARIKPVALQPCVHQALGALMEGLSPSEYAEQMDLGERTAWQYMTRGAQVVPGEELRPIVRRLVSRDLWAVLRALEDEGSPVLGGKLSDVMEEVLDRVLAMGPFLNSSFQWDELRLARLTLAAV